ncbi:hypothetical protein BDZ91DRAFT_731100 [Kalaharituber pfeilii]|nr:hypothetical protein BDZ91DRAFT_731100 [Kalaharituber pfeilii]
MPLHIQLYDSKSFQFLVSMSSDVCIQNHRGETALTRLLDWLVCRGYGWLYREQYNMTQALLVAGAWKDIRNTTGTRATLFHPPNVHFLQRGGFQAVCLSLAELQPFCVYQHQDPNGYTPLNSTI